MWSGLPIAYWPLKTRGGRKSGRSCVLTRPRGTLSRMANSRRIHLAHELFVSMVAQGHHQTDAYREAFPNSKKWKPMSVVIGASKLMSRPHIRARYEEIMAKAALKNEITQEVIVAELAKIAFSNYSRLVTWDENGVRLHSSGDLSEDDTASVAEVSETLSAQGSAYKLKTHDKVKALEILGKHVGMFKERSESPTEVNITITRATRDDSGSGAD